MVDPPHYAKSARTFGFVLSLVEDDDPQREVVLQQVRNVMAEFSQENLLFNARLFAATVAQTAFPQNVIRHSPLIDHLLKGE